MLCQMETTAGKKFVHHFSSLCRSLRMSFKPPVPVCVCVRVPLRSWDVMGRGRQKLIIRLLPKWIGQGGPQETNRGTSKSDERGCDGNHAKQLWRMPRLILRWRWWWWWWTDNEGVHQGFLVRHAHCDPPKKMKPGTRHGYDGWHGWVRVYRNYQKITVCVSVCVVLSVCLCMCVCELV